jgi:hypothetical protein
MRWAIWSSAVGRGAAVALGSFQLDHLSSRMVVDLV